MNRWVIQQEKSRYVCKHKKMVQGAPTDSSLYNFTSNVMWCVIYCLFIHTNSVYEYMIMCFFILINSLITKFSFYCLLLKNVLILAGNLPIQSIAQWWVMSFPPSSFLLIKKHDKFRIFFYKFAIPTKFNNLNNHNVNLIFKLDR